MDKIIGLGNILVDVSVRLANDEMLDRLALPKGSMQLIDVHKMQSIRNEFKTMQTHLTTGGSACNTVLALGHLGNGPGLVGRIGCDEYGDFFRRTFRGHGVETKFIRESPEAMTGTASTFISSDGQRTFGTYLGAASTICQEDLSEEALGAYSYLYIEGYLVQDHDLLRAAIRMAKRMGLHVCIDLASYNVVEANRDFFLEILPDIDLAFANEDEALALARTEDEKAALDFLSQRCRVAVMKVGPRGAWAKQGSCTVHVPAMEVAEVVDTNVAGDFFAAGFLHGYVRGASLEQCGSIGSLLAGHVIQVIGSALPEETWNEIKLNIRGILAE